MTKREATPARAKPRASSRAVSSSSTGGTSRSASRTSARSASATPRAASRSTTRSSSSSAPRGGSLIDSLFAREAAPPWSLQSALLTVAFSAAVMFIGIAMAVAWVGEAPFYEHVGWGIGGVLMIAFVLQTRRSARERAALRLDPPRTPLFFLLFLGLGAAIAVDVVSAAADRGQFLPMPEMLANSVDTVTAFIAAALFMVLVQPIAEELVFRGVVYPALSAFGGWVRWLGSSALYAAFHAVIYTSAYGTPESVAWHAFFAPLLMGLIFGAVRARTGSTRGAIYFHVAFGLFALARALVLN